MNIRDLRYLVAVADHRHFGKASFECFVSQPALSMQLQKLESELGVQLIERTTKKVLLTEVGENIVEYARKILTTVQDIEQVALAAQNPFSGPIHLGAFPTLAPFLLPKIARPIQKALPNIQLLLTEEKTDALLSMLHKGEIDCALVSLPIPIKGLESTTLFEEPFLLAVSKEHTLSQRKRIRLSEIVQEPLLLLDEGHCLRGQALELCSLIGASTQLDFRATSIETLRQMVATGTGSTLIPQIARQDNDGLTYIPFTKPSPSRTIALVWRKTSSKKQCLQEIARTIHSIMNV